MIERRHCSRLALESRDPFRIGRVRLGQNLDCDLAIQLEVAGAIHLAHATRTEQADNFVRAETTVRRQAQSWANAKPISRSRQPHWKRPGSNKSIESRG